MGIAPGATTCTSTPRARSEAATSRPMKLAPITTARRAAEASVDEGAAIGAGPQIVDVRQVVAGAQPHGLRAGRQQQGVIGVSGPVSEFDVARRRCRCPPTRASSFSSMSWRPVELGRAQRIGAVRRCPGEKALRQVGTVAGRRGVGAQHRQAPGIAFAPERFGRRLAGGAAADDHDRVGQAGAGRQRAARGGRAPRANAHEAVGLLHVEAGDRCQGGRAERLAGAQAEAGVVPGTANGVAHQESINQRRQIAFLQQLWHTRENIAT